MLFFGKKSMKNGEEKNTRVIGEKKRVGKKKMRFLARARIIGKGMTTLGKLGKSPSVLMMEALESALADGNVRMKELDGLISVPALAEPRFMEAHYLATQIGLLPNKGTVVRTIDTGGGLFPHPHHFFIRLFSVRSLFKFSLEST